MSTCKLLLINHGRAISITRPFTRLDSVSWVMEMTCWTVLLRKMPSEQVGWGGHHGRPTRRVGRRFAKAAAVVAERGHPHPQLWLPTGSSQPQEQRLHPCGYTISSRSAISLATTVQDEIACQVVIEQPTWWRRSWPTRL